MGEGWHRLMTEIGRFMAVGGIATFAAFVIFNFLAHGLYLTDDPWLTARRPESSRAKTADGAGQ